jgi:hypothetical protein
MGCLQGLQLYFLRTLVLIQLPALLRRYAPSRCFCYSFLLLFYCSYFMCSLHVHGHMVTCGVLFCVSYFLTGEKSTTRFTSRHWALAVYLLFFVHAGLCCHCWSGTLLCNGSRYPYLISFFCTRDAMGSVSLLFWSNAWYINFFSKIIWK